MTKTEVQPFKGHIIVMKAINKTATVIFFQLLNKMEGKEYLKIEKEGFMPLTIERIGIGIETAGGKGSLYALLHHYVQEGDLMKDPQVDFLVVDRRTEITNDIESVKIFPCSFEQSNLGIYEDSIIFRDNAIHECMEAMQRDHADFAEIWLQNIKEYGFLD